MTSRHLVDPELLPLLDMWPTVTLTHENLAAMRARELPLPPADTQGTELDSRRVPGPAGAPDIGLHIYRPVDCSSPLPCIYHIHGGGFVGGAAKDLEHIHRPLVRELGCVIVSVDYRLAPETRFPGAIEDCYAGLAWTFARTHELAIDPRRIGVMGESAGGGLAAALALLARDRGEHVLAFQHLIYPMIDDRTCVAQPSEFAGEFVWTADSNAFGWASLLGVDPGSEGISPYAAAARADDLAKLPPTFISTGSLDLFADEDIAYARRLIQAGVPTELHVFPGGFHGYDIAPGARIADAARDASRAALRRAMFG
ncbi:alpha/beta hydrolase fold domain-containing protein [Porphyrobacter algicida]|uniref:Alpha/beta hydrolase fold domain-containing protein n=1 Tax=Qipengyuania algicida TaxID=1836209 RepID=A0A845AHK1_9SPHN|nr:alpha/beta hydrolase [Qipengyuania algicida]MXP29730.1 alpha/beta hydrolase fold domain-containing protein [Qipengyuania algicida]